MCFAIDVEHTSGSVGEEKGRWLYPKIFQEWATSSQGNVKVVDWEKKLVWLFSLLMAAAVTMIYQVLLSFWSDTYSLLWQNSIGSGSIDYPEVKATTESNGNMTSKKRSKVNHTYNKYHRQEGNRLRSSAPIQTAFGGLVWTANVPDTTHCSKGCLFCVEVENLH